MSAGDGALGPRRLAHLVAAVLAVGALLAAVGFAFVSRTRLDGWLAESTFSMRTGDGVTPIAPPDLAAASEALGGAIAAGLAGLALAGVALALRRSRPAEPAATAAAEAVPGTSEGPFGPGSGGLPTGTLSGTILESRELFAQSHDLVFVLDPRGRFGAVNPRFEETLGYGREEILDLRFSDVLRPDQVPFWQELFAAARHGERSQSFEMVLLAKDGSEVLVEGFCWPRLNSAGDFVELRGLLLDITERQRAEREQARGEERFRTLFARIPIGLLVYDPETFTIVEANRRVLEQLGYARADLLGRSVLDLIEPSEHERFRERLAGQPSDHPEIWRNVRSDGTVIDVESSAYATEFADRPARLAFVRDVTEELRTRRALRESEGRYRAMFENSLALICMHDLEGTLIAVNSAVGEQLGYPAESAPGKKLVDFLAPEARRLFSAYLERLDKVGSAQGVMRVLTRTGEERYWNYHTTRFDREDGAPYVLGHAIDVTEHRRAEEALAHSERRHRELFESSGDLIQSLDGDGRFQLVNPRWLAVLGYRADEVRGLGMEAVIAPDELAHCQGIFERLTAGREQQLAVRTTFVARDGRRVHVEGTVSSVFEEGRFVATQGFFRDVTEQNRLEAERQTHLERIERQKVDLEIRNREVERANRHKSEFLATMSHELRTPLTAIIGFSDLLADGFAGDLTESQANYLGFVRKGARHLLQLINDVLDMSKIEAGRLDLDREDLLVLEVVSEVRSTIEPLAAAKRLDVTAEVAEDLVVFADRVRLRQVFYNLVSNAVKFAQDGTTIRIEGARVGRFACLSVRDSGPGIPAEHQETIFLPFHQLANNKREGTGLGLAIVRRLVEQHGGRIWVESSPGKGSVFAFLIPIGSPVEAQHVSVPEPLRVDRRERPMIAVVEDDAAWCELLAGQLESVGYEVTTMGWEASVSARILALAPELVLLEVLAGQGAGWRLLEVLGSRVEPEAPPIIVVSDLDERRRGFSLGAADYLVKPVSREMLTQVVARHVPPTSGAKPAPVVVLDHRHERQRLISDAIHAVGLRPLGAREGKELLEILAWVRPCALVVALDLPEMDGYQTLLRLRADPNLAEVPVVAIASEADARGVPDLLGHRTRVVLGGTSPDAVSIAQELRHMLDLPMAPEASGNAAAAPPA